MTAVRSTSRLTPWLRFFLIGVTETADASIQVFKDILALKERIQRESLPAFATRRQPNAQKLMSHLYQHPVINIRQTAALLATQPNTASALISDFEKLGILREVTGQPRHRCFVFDAYLKIFSL